MLKIIFLLSLLFGPTKAEARSTPELIEHLSGVVFEKCSGAAIEVFQNPCEEEPPNAYKKYEWPYTREELRGLFSQLNSFSWETFSPGPSMNGLQFGMSNWVRGQCHGQKIIKCGAHYVDISGSDYFLDDVKIDVPTTINNAVGNSAPVIQNSAGAAIAMSGSAAATSGAVLQQQYFVEDKAVGALIEALKTNPQTATLTGSDKDAKRAIELLEEIREGIKSSKPDKESMGEKLAALLIPV